MLIMRKCADYVIIILTGHGDFSQLSVPRKVTFCLIITISWSEGSTVFCKLEFRFLRQENFD